MTWRTMIKTWTLVLVSTSVVFLLVNGLFVERFTGGSCGRGLVPPTGPTPTPEEQHDPYGDLFRPLPIQRTTWAWFAPNSDPLGSGPNYADRRIGVPLIWFEHNQVASHCTDAWRVYTGFYAGAFLVDLSVAAVISGCGSWLLGRWFSRRRAALHQAV